MTLIDAVYINATGGKVLLQELLGAVRGRAEVAVLRDTRAIGLDTCGFRVFDLPPSERARARFYADHADRLRRVLCFGNVPPPRRPSAPTAVYFHNMLLCQPDPVLGWRTVLDCRIKMAYIRFRRTHADRFLVQSPSVATALAARLGDAKIDVVPFYASSAGVPAEASPGRWQRYAYVSNGFAHKNHLRLLAAWRQLAAQGLRPELHLTLQGDFPELTRELELARAAGANIVNHGFTDPRPLYARCGYQIYPSLIESFGLGLVEAAEAGCAVIAAERPYVRSVIVPHATFEPTSVDAIAAAVRRTCGQAATASTVIVPNRINDLVAWLADGQPLN